MTDEARRVVAGLRYCDRQMYCENLHNGEKCPDYDSCHDDNLSRNKSLADLIESLSAELEQVKQERDGLNILLGQAQSMLETRTHERDAAVEKLKRADVDCIQCKFSLSTAPCHESDFNCAECKVTNCVCKDCTDNSNWQWRGIQEEHK